MTIINKKVVVSPKSRIEEDAVGKYAEFYLADIGEAVKEAVKEERERIIKLLDKGKEHDYEAIGMGSLDYHEKCAVDAYIEWLKALLTQKHKGKEVK